MTRTAWILPALAFWVCSQWPDVAPAESLHVPRTRRIYRTTARATVFGYPGDRYAGGNAAFLGRPINPDPVHGDRCIAHRTLPRNTRVWLTYRGRRWSAYVCDRGPYGCKKPDGVRPAPDQRQYLGRWLCTKSHHVGDHFGDVDIAAPLAADMGLEGRKRVTLEYVR